ncbi:hypothetical protein KRMM14A1004_31620 [Krasilnikovia sp. MM14-A1004]
MVPTFFWISADMAGSAMFSSRYTPTLMRTSTWSGWTPAFSRQAVAAAEARAIDPDSCGSVLTAVEAMAVGMVRPPGS